MAAFLLTLLVAGLALSLAMAGAWAAAERTRRSSVIDATWVLATGALAVAALALAPAPDAEGWRRVLAAGLVGVWSLRLGLHLALRAARGGDDPRYAHLRAEWGADAPRRLFLFLQAQALAGVPLVAAALLAGTRPGPFDIFDALGTALVLVALAGEALADRQLAAFRAHGQGGVCDAGLWGLTRHPNYFFEWLLWCGIALLALDLSGAHPAGWLALLAPASMYGLLVHVSGIPPLEAHMLRTRGAAFRAYMARVNAFWPGPPKAGPQANQRDVAR